MWMSPESLERSDLEDEFVLAALIINESSWKEVETDKFLCEKEFDKYGIKVFLK